MNRMEFDAKLASIQEVTPEPEDLAALSDAVAINDGTTESLEDIMSAMDFSGKLNIRIPKSLHCKLSQDAKADGVSLNQYILYKLAQ